MSEHHNIEDCAENKEEGETNIVSPDETETETNEYFEFEEETLQITDVHAIEQSDGEFPVHGTSELSSSSRLWTSNESPASVTRFLDQTPEIDTVHHGAVDLQSEFAALGLNSLYPSAGQDLDSSCKGSFEKNTSPKNHSNIIVTGVNNGIVHSSINFIESNLDIIEDIHCGDSKVSFNKLDDIPEDRNQALFNNLSSTSENLNSFDISIHKDNNIAKNSEEINHSNNPCMTTTMPHSNQIENNIEILHSFRTMDNGNDCRDNNNIQPSQSTFDDKSLEGIEQVCLRTNNISQDNFDGNTEENKCYILNASEEKYSELIADMSNFVENKPSNSDLLTEETDDVFVDAVDSCASNKDTIYSEENKLTSSCNSHRIGKNNSIDQPEKIKETNRPFEKIEETHQMELLGGTDAIFENTCAVGESMSENVVVKETYQVHQTNSKDIVEEMYAIEESLFKDNVVKEFSNEEVVDDVVENNIKETLHMQPSTSMEVVTEKHTMKEYVYKNDVKETCSEKIVKQIDGMKECVSEIEVIRTTYQMPQSSSKEVMEETNSMEEAKLENDVFKQTQQTSSGLYQNAEEESTFKDNVVKEINSNEIVEEIHAIEEYISDNDVVKETYNVQQTTSEKVVEETHATIELILEVGVEKETHRVQQSSSEKVVEDTQVMGLTTYENDVRKPHQTQISGSKEIVTDIHSMTESMFMPENNVTKETSSEDVLAEIYAMEESTFEDNVSSNEIVEKMHAIEDFMSVIDVVKETYHVQQTTSKDVEETHAVVEFMPEDDVKETHKVQQSTSEEVVEKTHVVELSIYENDVGNPHHMQIPSSTEIHTMEESVPEDNFAKESSSEDIVEEIYATEESTFEDNVSSNEIVEKMHAIEDFMSVIDVVKETYHVQQTTSKDVEETHAVVEFMPEDDVKETHKVQQSTSEEVVEKTHVVELSIYENDVGNPHHMQIPSSTEIHTMEESVPEDNFAKESSSEDIVEEIYATEESTFEDNVSSNEIVEKMHAIEDFMSVIDVVKETYHVQQTTSKDVEETHAVVEFMPEDDVKETHKVQQSTSEEVVEKTHVVELSIYENDVGNPHHMQIPSSTEIHTMEESVPEDNFAKESSSEDIVEEIYATEESTFEDNVVKEISYEVEEMFEMKVHMSENDFVNETCQLEPTTSEDFEEETNATVEFIPEVDIEKETHRVLQSSTEKVVEETQVMELSIYENDVRKPHHMQLLSSIEIVTGINSMTESMPMSGDNVAKETSFEEVIKEISAMEENFSENNVIKEAPKEQNSSLENATEGNHAVEERVLGNDVIKKIQQSSSDEVVEKSYAIEETTFEDNVAKETCAGEIVKDKHAMKECMSKKDVVKEANGTVESFPEDDLRKILHLQQFSSFKAVSEISGMEESTFQNNVVKETLQVQQSSFEEIHAMEEPASENIVVKETQHFQQSSSLDSTEESHAMDKSISEDNVKTSRSDEIVEELYVMEESKLENVDSKKTHKMQKSSPEEVVRTYRNYESWFKVDSVSESHQVQQSCCMKVVEEPLAMEISENIVVKETHHMQQSSSDKIIKETQSMTDSELEINFVRETCPVQLESGSEEVVEKTLVMGDAFSENNFNNDSFKINQSSSEEFGKENLAFQDLMVDNRVVKDTLQVQLFRLEEVGEGKREMNENVLDKLLMVEECPQEDKTDGSGIEETVYETVNQINSSKEDVCESKSSVTEENANIQTDFGPESSFHSFFCQRTVDMSLTIVGVPANNLDTSEMSSGSQEDKCKSPSDHLSQTLGDLIDNADIKDTNDFTAHSDQKMYDALYIPLSGFNDSTYSVTENGLQSFMEITMANTNVAMIEQNLNNTTKHTELHPDQRTKEGSENSKYNESRCSTVEREEPISCSTDSNFQYDSDFINNKNHEMMQQSMSDYVTNLSLNLAIPDSCHFSNISYTDDETRQKCEEQTESVLLMKWPAQYHNNIKLLNQQNHLLLESGNQKDTVINKLKLDNENLLQKLSEVVARSQDLNQENCTLKYTLNNSNKDEDIIINLQQENTKLFKDLEALKSIECEFFEFKKKSEEMVHSIENNRLAKESEIQVLKERIKELEHGLFNIGQTVTDFQSDSLEISKLVEGIQSKENQIKILLKDNSLLKEKVSCLSIHLKTLDELKQENGKLKDVLQLEKENSKDMDKLKITLKKQNDDICDQNEKLSKLVMDLNEKEQQIQDLFKDKVSLEEAVATLNNHLEELRKIEDENRQLKSDLQEEKDKREEILMLSKSLEEHTNIQVENISKLNSKISEKDYQIEALTNSNTDLKDVLETLNQRFEELKESDKENEKLKFSIKQRDEKVKEIISLKISLEEQVINLKAQNELLWNELKVTSTKEKSLYALKEERLLLEEKLSQMKTEIQEINNLKSDNEQLFDELTNKEDEIRNLTADKKKLKSSLIKANDKLNERDAEIERLSDQVQFVVERLNVLNDENTELQNRLDKATKEDEILQAELKDEILAESIGNVSEYLSSVIFENAYLTEEIIVYETRDKMLTEELMSLRKKLIEEKALFDSLQSEKESLVSVVGTLKETVTILTEELNKYKYQCNEIILLKEENETLTLKMNNLRESLIVYEDEKTCIFQDMSSLSETISNLLIDRQLLSEQLELSSEINERLVLLKAEKFQLEQRIVQHEQNNLVLLQSVSTLQNQLETVKDQEKLIDELKDLSSGLENHLSSMNEELMSEISKNQFLCVTVNELESKFIQNNEGSLVLQNRISSLTDQLNVSTEKHIGLQELIADLENHMSSLNEELMSEIAKNHFLLLENENLQCQQKEIIEEKLLLENMVSRTIESIKNRLQKSDDVSNKQVSLQTYINKILLELSNFENENLKLNCDINNYQATLQNSNQSLSDLLKAKQNLEIELSTTMDQKLELENRLTMALAKESDIKTLEKENEILLKIAETHKSCEDAKRLLQNEKSNLEVQIQTLTEAIDVLRRDQHQFDTQLKENVQLKEVMTKEIHSLTGENWDFKVEPLIEVYQRLMKEFLNKEKEVIFSIQSDFECKIKITQDKIISLTIELNEKDVLTSKLENEVEECKMQLNHRDTLISRLENELFTVKNESNRSYEIEEIRLQAEKEKETLLAELKNVQHVETKLQEKFSTISDEVNSKNNEILQLKTDLEKVQCEKTNLLRRIEEDCGVSKHQKDFIDELTSKLNDKQELISQLDLQLQNKNNEVSQLTEYLENKEIETRQYLMKIEEMTPAISKLNAIESEFDLIKKVTSLDEEFDIESFVGSLQACKVFGDITKLIVSKFVKNLKQLQVSNDNLKVELSNKIEVCKSLETQINDMNEELKSCKLLYDEASLQFKEEIAANNVVISNLTEALEQLKRNACLDVNLKTECTEMESMKEELNKLKQENTKLQNESNKITYLAGVNRKLSWEIEELSRSIKIEKENNVDLKAKCDLASNQVADLSKKNFQLEDKIGDLERKLENHDIMSSLKIGFPLGINTLDKQVQYINEKLAEFDQINSKFNKLNDEHNSLKYEYEKSKEYIKQQEEKLCKIMKRELELKKQIVSNLQTSPEIKILKELKTELLSLFPSESLSLAEVLLKIKSLCEGENKVLEKDNTEIMELKQKIEELAQDNKDLDLECEMMNKHIKEQEELLASVFKREEELKKINAELKSHLPNHLQINVEPPAVDNNLEELFELFLEKPVSLKDSVNLIKLIMQENQTLKEKISESQEEYASLDKECEDMFTAYKEKEKDLADVLKREASSVSDLKSKQRELENELKALSEELQVARSQLIMRDNPKSLSTPCECEELKSRLSELKVDLAERNAKITALEMQFEADNFPLKKKVADLEKSLDQAKQKINELKSEVRRYREQMCDVTVGLRAECERCRSPGTAADPTALTTLQQQLQEKIKEIQILKALCRSRKQRIKELEERDDSYKVPRSQRVALKEVKENQTVTPLPTKPSKGSLQ